MSLDRRRFLLDASRLAAWYAVFDLCGRTGAWAKGFDLDAVRWAKELAEICRAVQAGTLPPVEWQSAIARLHARIPLEEIVQLVDMDVVVARVRVHVPEHKLGVVENVKWPGLELPSFGRKLFVYRKGHCTPPHAHNNVVSAHLVLQGRIRARTFNRVEDLERSILIQPTGDRTVGPGNTVTMSDLSDNVHWFEGVSDLSVSFDVPVGGIAAGIPYRHQAEMYNQIYLDPTVAARGDGRIEAPVIKFQEAVEKFA